MEKRILRPYQTAAIQSLRDSIKAGHRRPILQLPTGGGKTLIAAEIVSRAIQRRNRAMFVVPAISLIDQTVNSFFHHGIDDIGVMQADHPMTDASKLVQVASVQTLARRRKPDNLGLVLVDEAHRQNRDLLAWMATPEMATVPVIGLSATPWAKGMAKHWDDLIVCSTTARMIEDGYLSPFRVYAASHPDLSGVRTVAGDYHEGDLSTAMSSAELVADAVQTWIKHGNGEPTLCFAVNRSHAKTLQGQFEAAGIPCGYVDAFTTPTEFREVERKFANREYPVVVNVGCLTTGVDWDVRCISLCRPTKSEMLICQIIGRGLRLAPGKEVCTILDHTDTTLRLGFVTDIHHDTLDDGKPKKPAPPRKEILPKECSSCGFLRPPKVSQCPACGFKPSAQDVIEVQDGELIEVTRGKGKRFGPKDHIKLQGVLIPHSSFLAQLRTYAKSKGYLEGWVANQYRAATGVWPHKSKMSPDEPVSYPVHSWIRSRQIAYAKGMEKSKSQGATHAA